MDGRELVCSKWCMGVVRKGVPSYMSLLKGERFPLPSPRACLMRATLPYPCHSFNTVYQASNASLVAQLVKNLPAMQETWVWSLGWEDPLEKGMATHSSILSWRIPQTEEPGGLQSMWSRRVRYNWATNTFTNYLPGPISRLNGETEAPVKLLVWGLPAR